MVKELSFIRRNVEFEPHSCYVLVGLRRAGKSYMLYQRIHDLLHSKAIPLKEFSTSTLKMTV